MIRQIVFLICLAPAVGFAEAPVLRLHQLSLIAGLFRLVDSRAPDLHAVTNLAEHLQLASRMITRAGRPRPPYRDEDLLYHLRHAAGALPEPIERDQVLTLIAATMTTEHLRAIARLDAGLFGRMEREAGPLRAICPGALAIDAEASYARLEELLRDLPTYRPRAVRLIRLVR